METETRSPDNAVDLMVKAFESVRMTAPRHKLLVTSDNEVTLLLESGPNEGQAARLYWTGGNRQLILAFYSFHQAALDVTRDENAWLKFSLDLLPARASDPFYGNLYSISFFMSDPDLSLLIRERRKLMPFAIEFLQLIEKLRGHHMWHADITSTWNFALVKFKHPLPSELKPA